MSTVAQIATRRSPIGQTARVRSALHAAPVVLPLPDGQDGATVTLQPLLCGQIRGPAGWFEADPGLAGTLRALGVGVPKHQLIRVPIVAFLIEHPTAGSILIDTGFHPVIADGRPTERNRNLGPIGRLVGRNVELRAEQAPSNARSTCSATARSRCSTRRATARGTLRCSRVCASARR